MPKANRVEIEPEISDLRDEDTETLAAIDEGVRDAEAGRTVPAEEVRTRLTKWITSSFTRKGR
jgi:predicted transcriptional regulator